MLKWMAFESLWAGVGSGKAAPALVADSESVGESPRSRRKLILSSNGTRQFEWATKSSFFLLFSAWDDVLELGVKPLKSFWRFHPQRANTLLAGRKDGIFKSSHGFRVVQDGMVAVIDHEEDSTTHTLEVGRIFL